MKSVSAWMKEKWKDYILGVLHKLRGQVKALTYPLSIVYRSVQRRAPIARSSVLQISVGSLRFFFNYKASDYFLVFPADNFIIITQKKRKVTRGISILLLILTKKSEQ